MSSPALSVAHLHKMFKVWNKPSDILREMVLGGTRHSEFHALSDISFDLPRGSVVGIMGRNGAGKSTLLRIIAGTLNASSGSVAVNGRISAILELGTGFHPDYSGRENIFLGGMCLGLSRQEIAARFDEIVDFAELSEFIDRPFRTFSSGMQARLTFAVATSIEPDILIIDEALSVGDARFALKSFDRIQAFKRQGRSILIVSHNINQISTFCDHAILLERGRVLSAGEPALVGNLYHELLFGSEQGEHFHVEEDQVEPAGAMSTAQGTVLETTSAEMVDDAPAVPILGLQPVVTSQGLETEASPRSIEPSAEETGATVQALVSREHRYGDRAVIIGSIEIRTSGGIRTTFLKSLDTYEIVCELRARRNVHDLCIGILFRNVAGIDLFGWDSRAVGVHALPDIEAGGRRIVRLKFRNSFAAGTYFLTVSVARTDEHKHDLRFDALEVTVAPTPHIFTASVVDLEVEAPVVDDVDNHAELGTLS